MLNDKIKVNIDKEDEFNYLPTRYLHRTWWKTLEYGKELAILAGFERSETRVASIIFKSFNLNGHYKNEFKTVLEQMMLLTEAELRQLINHVGLCLTYQNISNCILKEKKLEYKRELGSEAYLFATEKAKELCEANNISETYLVKKTGVFFQNHTLGLQVFEKAILNAEKELKQRFILKLGTSCEQSFNETAHYPDLSTSKPDCVSLIEAVGKQLGFVGSKKQGAEKS